MSGHCRIEINGVDQTVDVLHRRPPPEQFVADSPLEGTGFEPSVPPSRRARLSVCHLGCFLVVLPRIYGFYARRAYRYGAVRGTVRARNEPYGPGCRRLLQASRDGVLVFVATTLPQFFLVAVSWPREMIPPLLDHIRRVFPSESAIDGLVRINQMGATLSEVRADWLYLWLLAAIYFILAVVVARRRASIAS